VSALMSVDKDAMKERADAMHLLTKTYEMTNISSVWAIVHAADSDLFIGGKRREYVLYIDKDRKPRTAILCGESVVDEPGW
jgi:hypothetical protein